MDHVIFFIFFNNTPRQELAHAVFLVYAGTCGQELVHTVSRTTGLSRGVSFAFRSRPRSTRTST